MMYCFEQVEIGFVGLVFEQEEVIFEDYFQYIEDFQQEVFDQWCCFGGDIILFKELFLLVLVNEMLLDKMWCFDVLQ